MLVQESMALSCPMKRTSYACVHTQAYAQRPRVLVDFLPGDMLKLRRRKVCKCIRSSLHYTGQGMQPYASCVPGHILRARRLESTLSGYMDSHGFQESSACVSVPALDKFTSLSYSTKTLHDQIRRSGILNESGQRVSWVLIFGSS